MDNLVIYPMPALQGKKEVVIGSKVSQAEFDTLQKICENEDRSMSYVLRELAMRGLVQYFHDGRLKTDAGESELIEQATKIIRAGGIAVAPKAAKGIPIGNPKALTQKRREDAHPKKTKSKRFA